MDAFIIALCISLFLGLKLFFKLGFIFSIISSLVLYVALSLMTTKTDNEILISNMKIELDKSKDVVNKISKYESLIDNKNIKSNIKEICNLSNKIIDAAVDKKKESSVKRFINYYLPFTLKILADYNDIEDKKLSSKESKKFMEKVDTLTSKIKVACEKTLDSLYEGDIINTNADIKVFESMLKSDGLVDDNMNIKIGSGKVE